MLENNNNNPKVLWIPSQNSEFECQIDKFVDSLNIKKNSSLKKISNYDDYEKLHQWTCDNFDSFWEHLFYFLNIKFEGNLQPVIDDKVISKIPRWFSSVHINYTENLLNNFQKDSDKIRIVQVNESGFARFYSSNNIIERIALIQAVLSYLNVMENDIIAVISSNTFDAFCLFLATTSIGAIFTGISPDLGATATLQRLSQVRPKILFACHYVIYNGKIYYLEEKIKRISTSISSIVKVIFFDLAPDDDQKNNIQSEFIFLSDLIEKNSILFSNSLKFAKLSFNHPLLILYSSGSTGKPKCLIHSHGGTLLQNLKEHVLHGNLQKNDVFLQYTNIGWMMWPWMISSLFLGLKLVLYDGSPAFPTQKNLLHICNKFDVTILGTSAKYLQNIKKHDEYVELTKLRTLFSTGSPLDGTTMEWCYERLQRNMLLASITGGSDIIGLFAGGLCKLPVHKGEIQVICLGMDVDTVDGKSEGDLICKKPFPSMPKLLGDVDNIRLRQTYFQFGNYWYHGDFIKKNHKTGGIVVLGRSDGTLNPSGIRFGSSEIYNILEEFFYPLIIDSIVIGVKSKIDLDEKIILFVQTKNNVDLNPLKEKIKGVIRSELSPRHIPHLIIETPIIPYNQNGKKMEIQLKNLFNNKELDGFDSPNLEFFRNLKNDANWIKQIEKI